MHLAVPQRVRQSINVRYRPLQRARADFTRDPDPRPAIKSQQRRLEALEQKS